jgi:hypothetical protein
MKSEPITLEVLNPRGVLHMVPISGLSNPRPKTLAGKTIALLSEKTESTHFFDALAELLKKKYPTANILRFDSPANPMRPDNTLEVARQCDVWLQGVKTSGSSEVDYDIKMEKQGRPGAAFCIDSLIAQRKRLAEVNGLPSIRIIPLPGIDYLGAEGYPDKMRPVAAAVLEAAIHALTDPLTGAEKNPSLRVFDYGPLKFTGQSCTDAVKNLQQYFVDHYLGDGLPVIPPTREAVDWMLTGTTRSPDEEIGLMMPRNGLATIEKIAINAVMAGARPEYLPVIIAAIEGVTEKGFNLYHLSTSTACPTPIIWVNGPLAQEIGMNSGAGYLGRGCRANNAIGRAIGLCMINIGWRLLNADQGFVGDPEGFCNFTFAENEKASPWQSFAVENGFKPKDSTVTVNETMYYSRMGPGGGMSSQTWEQSLESLAKIMMGSGGVTSRLGWSKVVRYQIALNPTLARQLAEAGFNQKSLAKWLFEKTSVAWDQLNQAEKQYISTGVTFGMNLGLKKEDLKPGLIFRTFEDPRQVAILVAGDPASNCVVWYSPVGSTSVNTDLAATIKTPPKHFMTKIIRGAALTVAGR